jgi:hypothetical protein
MMAAKRWKPLLGMALFSVALTGCGGDDPQAAPASGKQQPTTVQPGHSDGSWLQGYWRGEKDGQRLREQLHFAVSEHQLTLISGEPVRLTSTSAEVSCNYKVSGPIAISRPTQEEQEQAASYGLPAPQLSVAAVADRIQLIGRSAEIADCQAFASTLSQRYAGGIRYLVANRGANDFLELRSGITYSRWPGFTDPDGEPPVTPPPGEENDQLGAQGTRYRLEIGAEDVSLSGAKKPLGPRVDVLLHHGYSYSATSWFHPEAGEEYCLLKLDYGAEYPAIAACGGRYPTLVLPAGQVIELVATQVNAIWDAQEQRNRISSVAFSLNGIQLFKENGKPSQTLVTGMECFGTDMTLTHLANSWGADRVLLNRL